MSKKQNVKKLELGVGTSTFSNSTTLHARPGKIELEINENGVLFRNVQKRLAALIPFANIKAMELEYYTDEGELTTGSLKPVKK